MYSGAAATPTMVPCSTGFVRARTPAQNPNTSVIARHAGDTELMNASSPTKNRTGNTSAAMPASASTAPKITSFHRIPIRHRPREVCAFDL